MALTDEIAAMAPVAGPPQSSWVKDLIDKRYQPKTERLKRSPVGFDFKREPFDPSSYYRALGTFKDISRAATNVTRQEVANREEAERARDNAASQQALMDSMSGIDPRFTYAANTGASKKYGLKGVSPNTSKAADYFGSRYGIKTIGGMGAGSVPGSDHPKGRALDFMTSNKSKGTALANDLIKNAKSWNVKYVIWNRYIWQPGRGWKKYNGPSPHTDHVHASFNK
jgi:hypothetical protein